jgi:hypothetical protein
MPPKRNRIFGQRCLRLAKMMSTTTKWSNCGPYINKSSAFGSYASDWRPLRAHHPGGRFPGLKPWAKSYSPCRAKTSQTVLIFVPFNPGLISASNRGGMRQPAIPFGNLLWPRSEGYLGDSSQLRAGCAAGCLDRHSLVHGCEITSEIGWISV